MPSHPLRLVLILTTALSGGAVSGPFLGTTPLVHAQTTSPLTIQPNTGRVGIGTATPLEKLHIDGSTKISGALIVGDQSVLTTDASAIYVGDGAAGDGLRELRLRAGDVDRVIITTTGNVGIGTSTPSAKLHVDGSARIAGALVVGDQSVLTTNASTIYVGDLAGGDGLRELRLRAGDVDRVVVTTTGNVEVNGTLSAVSKNFQIDHPLGPSEKFLIHSALEGPEVAVYYRGEAQLVNGEVAIELSAYFEALTRKEQRTVQLTPVGGWSPLYVVDGVQQGRFVVRTPGEGNPAQRFYWEVKAVRADVPLLVVEKSKGAQYAKPKQN